ncbi:thioredoxin family protein [Winogradskyella flava]|uniref:Thioredoxin family protein n=1 Tax=Winogradskyella flava TaxID=1884876 RepID=A0A842ITI8_9FLAO|nr:thioredoxin family protein [Winogradskyella flava]MBC2846492.1 thioredoxin family protein [Winogradskyella flava]
MRKNFIPILVAFIITFQVNAQTLNTEITENTKTPYLLGKIDKSGLEGDNYKSWFTKNYNDYKPNASITSAISSELKSYTITLFMGTWCGDSKREVPKLYKVLEASNFPMEQLTVVAVSRQPDLYKQSPQHEEAGLNIHRVPIVIFYKNGKEVNRIVEHPVNSFEEDIENIVTVNNYKSNYQIVTAVDNILKTKGLKGFNKNKKQIFKKYKDNLKSISELNTYAHILFTTDRKKEAIEVLKFNTKLFPKEPRTYSSLANKFYVNGDIKKALKLYKKALKLDPKNEQIQKNIATLKSN